MHTPGYGPRPLATIASFARQWESGELSARGTRGLSPAPARASSPPLGTCAPAQTRACSRGWKTRGWASAASGCAQGRQSTSATHHGALAGKGVEFRVVTRVCDSLPVAAFAWLRSQPVDETLALGGAGHQFCVSSTQERRGPAHVGHSNGVCRDEPVGQVRSYHEPTGRVARILREFKRTEVHPFPARNALVHPQRGDTAPIVHLHEGVAGGPREGRPSEVDAIPEVGDARA